MRGRRSSFTNSSKAVAAALWALLLLSACGSSEPDGAQSPGESSDQVVNTVESLFGPHGPRDGDTLINPTDGSTHYFFEGDVVPFGETRYVTQPADYQGTPVLVGEAPSAPIGAPTETEPTEATDANAEAEAPDTEPSAAPTAAPPPEPTAAPTTAPPPEPTPTPTPVAEHIVDVGSLTLAQQVISESAMPIGFQPPDSVVFFDFIDATIFRKDRTIIRAWTMGGVFPGDIDEAEQVVPESVRFPDTETDLNFSRSPWNFPEKQIEYNSLQEYASTRGRIVNRLVALGDEPSEERTNVVVQIREEFEPASSSTVGRGSAIDEVLADLEAKALVAPGGQISYLAYEVDSEQASAYGSGYPDGLNDFAVRVYVTYRHPDTPWEDLLPWFEDNDYFDREVGPYTIESVDGSTTISVKGDLLSDDALVRFVRTIESGVEPDGILEEAIGALPG